MSSIAFFSADRHNTAGKATPPHLPRNDWRQRVCFGLPKFHVGKLSFSSTHLDENYCIANVFMSKRGH